jgi:hypothetical protein
MKKAHLTVYLVGGLVLGACDPSVLQVEGTTERRVEIEKSGPEPERETTGVGDVATESPEMQSLAERVCGRCHVGSRDSSIPAALNVFDLSESQWWAELSSSQLEKFPGQFEKMVEEPGSAELELVRSWVERVERERAQK